MGDVVIIGGGPAGLSAALFTAKNGLETEVFDTDKTWMHKAHLFNYPGIGSMDGTNYMETLREQTDDFDIERHQGTEVTGVESDGDGFAVSTDESEYHATCVVLATGANRDLAESTGCKVTDDGTVAVGVAMETSVEDLYATGAMVRAEEWQAVISAGDGAAAALNILTKERGGALPRLQRARGRRGTVRVDGSGRGITLRLRPREPSTPGRASMTEMTSTRGT